MDSWKEWRVVCLSILSVEDVEDVYLIGIMITGFLLFGAGSILIYRKMPKALAALIGKLPAIEGTGRAVNTQTQAICELNRKLDAIGSQIRMTDTNLEKLSVRLTEMGH